MIRRTVRTLAASFLIVLALASPAYAGNPHGQPPGNDGGTCHGANLASCRPDPQPSHGQDCLPHGHNADGNDDHCAPTPTPGPTGSLIPPATGTPPPDPDTTGTDVPNLTPPPTDTLAPAAAESSLPLPLIVFVVTLAGGIAAIASRLRKGR